MGLVGFDKLNKRDVEGDDIFARPQVQGLPFDPFDGFFQNPDVVERDARRRRGVFAVFEGKQVERVTAAREYFAVGHHRETFGEVAEKQAVGF